MYECKLSSYFLAWIHFYIMKEKLISQKYSDKIMCDGNKNLLSKWRFSKSRFLCLVLVQMKAFLPIYHSVIYAIHSDYYWTQGWLHSTTHTACRDLLHPINRSHMLRELKLIFPLTEGKHLEKQKWLKLLLQSKAKYKWLFFIHCNHEY